MIDFLRARIPKSLEQTEEALPSDPEKLFSSGRCLCEIKAVLVQVQKKIGRMLKSNLEREADFHHHFYIEGDILLSDPYRLGLGRGLYLLFHTDSIGLLLLM